MSDNQYFYNYPNEANKVLVAYSDRVYRSSDLNPNLGSEYAAWLTEAEISRSYMITTLQMPRTETGESRVYRVVTRGEFTFKDKELTGGTIFEVGTGITNGSGGFGTFQAKKLSAPITFRTTDPIEKWAAQDYPGIESTALGDFAQFFPADWGKDPFNGNLVGVEIASGNSASSADSDGTTGSTKSATSAVDTLTGTAKKADTFAFASSPNYNSSADHITNFSTKDKDKVQISSSVFGLSSKGTFKIAKNLKSLDKLSKSNAQFIYNKADGGLYFNQNGTEAGFGTGGIFAILDGKPTLGISSVSVVA